MNLEGVPIVAEQGADDAMDGPHGQLRRLPRGALVFAAQVERQYDHVILLFNAQAHRFIVNMDIARQRFDGCPYCCLLANDDPDRPEVGKAATLGHSQGKLVDPGRRGGSLEQAADAADRDAHVLMVKAGERKPCPSQHLPRIDSRRPRELGVMRQAGAANQVSHRTYPGNVPDCKIYVPTGQTIPAT